MYQKEALVEFVKNNRDLLINFSTGAGKSIIYLALPIIFNTIYACHNHVVVVSPLLNLMRDQVHTLEKLGMSAINLSDVKECDLKDLEGNFSVVYGTPEAWLKCERSMYVLTQLICTQNFVP